MTFETIALDRQGPVALLGLNRPDKFNAINATMIGTICPTMHNEVRLYHAIFSHKPCCNCRVVGPEFSQPLLLGIQSKNVEFSRTSTRVEAKLILRLLAFLISAFVIVGCAGRATLMPTPSVYLVDGYSEQHITPALRNRRIDLVYVTDRAPETDVSGVLTYGNERSASMAYGLAHIELGDEALGWPTLVEQSSTDDRQAKIHYNIDLLEELGRFPPTPYSFRLTQAGMEIEPSVGQQRDRQRAQLKDLIRSRLELTPTKDVYLFVHGFNNSFEDASITLAGIWHFLERQGVPLVYAWPAARGGLFGYFIDRESGEFTIYHLKETLRVLFAMPEIENIHIIAHSRGTDVATSTLRELVIENRAAGGNPRRDFRIANLVMAAPDLDFGVITQRLMAERFGPAFGQITIYTSEYDKALGISEFLMSGLRFGRVDAGDIEANERNIFEEVGNVSLINVPKSRSFIGHGYFHDNPAVSADLIRLIQSNAQPGSEKRPLTFVEGNFWRMEDNYLTE